MLPSGKIVSVEIGKMTVSMDMMRSYIPLHAFIKFTNLFAFKGGVHISKFPSAMGI